MESGGGTGDASSVIVHCFRCDDVVEAPKRGEGPLWCERCDDFVLAPVPHDADVRARPIRRRSFGAAMLASSMLGLQEALFGPIDEEPTIVMVRGEPERDDDIEVHLEERPADSWVLVKWR